MHMPVKCIHAHPPSQKHANLAYASAGMQAAVVAMGASAWEVRNAASLLFTALVLRMLGFRNMLKVQLSLLGFCAWHCYATAINCSRLICVCVCSLKLVSVSVCVRQPNCPQCLSYILLCPCS